MKLATWNVNSLTVRLPHLLDWLARAQPDVVALQELKMVDEKFPHAELAAAGYHAVTNGQKTYNGVALLTRLEYPFTDVQRDIPDFADEQKRVIAATINDIRVISVYVVNGQSLDSDKYQYKLRFLAALTDYLVAERTMHAQLAVLGDYNIAPELEDTHDPKVWEGGILCSAPERTALLAVQHVGLVDAYCIPFIPQGRFTWWDYRGGGYSRNLGLRIDHILVSDLLADRVQSWAVDHSTRILDRPSDHAPVVVKIHSSPR